MHASMAWDMPFFFTISEISEEKNPIFYMIITKHILDVPPLKHLYHLHWFIEKMEDDQDDDDKRREPRSNLYRKKMERRR